MFLLFDFTPQTSPYTWQVVDDGVMGGISQGQFSINEAGHGVFQGHVSLENNGGFSSLQYRFTPTNISQFDTVEIKVRGDGNRYQLRLKNKPSDSHSYVYYFETSGEWQIIRIHLESFYPTFRGRRLSIPNFAAEQLGEIGFLVDNKKEQDFRLEIDYIGLK
ncbi:MAG: CIA30 family protein [Bacteroidota bacterium]